ncbi:unnamed protein product [Calypogeia fissa]
MGDLLLSTSCSIGCSTIAAAAPTSPFATSFHQQGLNAKGLNSLPSHQPLLSQSIRPTRCNSDQHDGPSPGRDSTPTSPSSSTTRRLAMVPSLHPTLSNSATDFTRNPTSSTTRRLAMVQLGSTLLALHQVLGHGVEPSSAVGQNMLAGRIPGLSDPDGEGLRTYRRPDAKSGGHGVGWSPMIPYSFKVPTDWEEIPVSIADLGGTEIDLRFQSPSEGNLSVVVAPVLRFSSNLGDNVKIEDVGVPEKVIDAFGPELTGQTVEGKVKSMDVKSYGGRTYYQYELAVPHMLISATAAGNRLYLFSATGNGRQWKKYFGDLKDIRDSFRVG